MQRLFYLFILLTLLTSSCAIIVFEEPMPAGEETVDNFPENFRGDYRYYIDDLSAEITIGQNYFIRDSMAIFISDSLVVKPFGNGYVVNERINDPLVKSNGKWYAYILNDGKDGSINAISFTITDSLKQKKVMKKYALHLLEKDEVQTSLLFTADDAAFKRLSKDKNAVTQTILYPVVE